MTFRTSLPAGAVARILASIARRVLAGSASGPVLCVLFGGPVSVSVGDACLCTLHDVPGGVGFEWAPDSSEARALLLPMLDVAIGA